MTTGSLSDLKIAFVKDGWTYYDYTQKTWTGGDTPPNQRPKDKVVRFYKYFVTERINGHRVPIEKVHVRTRLVPSRSRSLPPHNYTVSGKSMKQDWFEITWSGGSQHEVGSFINELDFQSAWTANDDIKLLSKLRAEIAGSDFNAAVTAAESLKTLSMVSEHATRLAKTISSFRKGNFRKAADELFNGRRLKPPSKAASSNWLAMQYGWLPLLNDVSNGAQFLAYNFNTPRVFRVVVTRSLGQKGDSSYDQAVWGLRDGVSKVMGNLERKESKRIVALLTEVDVPALAGLRDPLSVAWELVPYSFVADWFIPIGNWLSARGLSQSIKGTFITSYVHRERLKNLWIKNQGSSNYAFGRRMERGEWSRWYFNRSVSTTLDVPTRPLVKPLGEVPGWRRAVSAVALLTQMRK